MKIKITEIEKKPLNNAVKLVSDGKPFEDGPAFQMTVTIDGEEYYCAAMIISAIAWKDL